MCLIKYSGNYKQQISFHGKAKLQIRKKALLTQFLQVAALNPCCTLTGFSLNSGFLQVVKSCWTVY